MCVVLIRPAGGKDGMVGFPDFIYKHIVPACFLAPLKPTFDLSDAQTVLVSFRIQIQSVTSLSDPFGSDGSAVPQTLAECALTLKMIHLKRVKILPLVSVLFTGFGRVLIGVCFPGVRVHPVPAAGVPAVSAGDSRDLSGRTEPRGTWGAELGRVLLGSDLLLMLVLLQELCHVLQQPDIKVLKNYIKVGHSPTRFWFRPASDFPLTVSHVCRRSSRGPSYDSGPPTGL